MHALIEHAMGNIGIRRRISESITISRESFLVHYSDNYKLYTKYQLDIKSLKYAAENRELK